MIAVYAVLPLTTSELLADMDDADVEELVADTRQLREATNDPFHAYFIDLFLKSALTHLEREAEVEALDSQLLEEARDFPRFSESHLKQALSEARQMRDAASE